MNKSKEGIIDGEVRNGFGLRNNKQQMHFI